MFGAVHCSLAIIKGLTKDLCREKMLSYLYYDVYQCIIAFEYVSAYYAWGTGHYPLNLLLRFATAKQPAVIMARQDLESVTFEVCHDKTASSHDGKARLRNCIRPHTFDHGIFACFFMHCLHG